MKTLKKLIIAYWPFVALALIVLYVCRGFLFKPGYFLFGEFIGSTNFIFFFKDALKSWSDYTILGHSAIGFPTTYGLHPAYMLTPPIPYILWFGMLSLFQIVVGASWGLKIYIILELIVPFLGMYFFALFWFKNHKNNRLLYQTLAFTAGIVYTINAAIGDRIYAGHLFYPLGYGLLPFYLFFLCTLVEETKKSKKIMLLLLGGVTFSLLLWMMPHLIIFALFFLGIYFLLFVMGDKKKTYIFFIGGFLTVVIGFLLDVHLWLPALFYSESYQFINNSEYILLYVYNSASYVTFDKILTLASAGEKTLLTVASYRSLFLMRLILPLLALILLIVNKDRKKSLFLFLLAVFGIIFGMGVNYPFEKIYGFLFQHVFLFEPFRDTSKFVIMYVFSLSLLLPTLFVYIYKLFGKWVLFAAFLFVVFLLHINPMFTSGNFAGNIQPFIYPHKYDVLKEFLAKDKQYYRVAVYPNDGTMGNYNWFPKLPNGSIHPTIFSAMIPLDKGLAVSNRTVGNFSSRYLDYIEANLDKDWAVKRLGEDRVKYLIVDPDMTGYQKYLSLLRNNSAVSQVNLVKGFVIFEIKNFSDQAVHKQNSVYYFGDMKGMQYLPSNLALINLGQNPLGILSNNFSKAIILYRSSLKDVFLNSLDDFRFSFFPEIRFVSDGTKNFVIGGEYLRQVTIDGISLYNPEAMLAGGAVSIEKTSHLATGRYKVFLSIINYQNFTDSIAIKIGNKLLTKKHFQGDKNTLIWLDFGEVDVNKNNPIVKIQNLQGRNLIVDSLLIVPKKTYDVRFQEFSKLTKDKKIIILNDQTDFTNLAKNEKQVTVLPQSYSPYWDVCGSTTFMVNFYALGTTCNNNKVIKPYFRPTVLFFVSLLLSLIFYILICYSMLRLYFKKHDKAH